MKISYGPAETDTRVLEERLSKAQLIKKRCSCPSSIQIYENLGDKDVAFIGSGEIDRLASWYCDARLMEMCSVDEVTASKCSMYKDIGTDSEKTRHA